MGACIEDIARLARARLRGAPRAVADEEDVALSAFDDLFRRARHGRCPRLANCDDLWRLLVRIAEHKAIDLSHHEQRRKRGGGKRIGTLDQPVGDGPGGDPHAVPANQPSPDYEVLLADDFERLLW
jgi:hypothetical protein